MLVESKFFFHEQCLIMFTVSLTLFIQSLNKKNNIFYRRKDKHLIFCRRFLLSECIVYKLGRCLGSIKRAANILEKKILYIKYYSYNSAVLSSLMSMIVSELGWCLGSMKWISYIYHQTLWTFVGSLGEDYIEIFLFVFFPICLLREAAKKLRFF